VSASELTELTVQGLWLVLLLSLPAVLTAVVIAVLVAVAQAVTQIQDQSIGQAARQIGVLLMVMVTAPWLAMQVTNFATRIFAVIAQGRVHL
jgi:type III secretion protein S